MSKQKDSLMKVLAYCNLPKLPEEDTQEYIWLKAIGLVAKADGTHSYVLLYKNKHNRPYIVKDFGSISTIVKTEKVYPILLFQYGKLPKFGTDSVKERIYWLKGKKIDADFENMSLTELNRLVLNTCVYNAVIEDKLYK